MNKNNAKNQQDDQLDLIAHTVVQHTDILTQHAATLAQHTTILNKHTATLAQHTVQLGRIVDTVVKHTEDIEWIKVNMAKKKDITDMSNTLDQILGLVKKKDQELTVMGERVKRIEDDVKKMKPLVVGVT